MDENKKEMLENIGNIATQLTGTIGNVVAAVSQKRQEQQAQKGVSFSGSYSNGNTMPSWLLPVGLGVAGLVSLFLIFKR